MPSAMQFCLYLCHSASVNRESEQAMNGHDLSDLPCAAITYCVVENCFPLADIIAYGLSSLKPEIKLAGVDTRKIPMH